MISSGIPYQKNLDGVRGIAILLVMLTHQHLNSFGWVGVPLFFVLSGFLITKILFFENRKGISIGSKLKNFWMRRILRIFPIYYLYLIVLLVIFLVFNFGPGLIRGFPYLLSYTYNFYISNTLDFLYLPIVHLWSLSVEEQFYLFYPFLVLLLNKKQLQVAIITLIIFSICFRFFYMDNLRELYKEDSSLLGEKMYYLTFSHFDSFLAGASIIIFKLNRIRTSILNFLLIGSFLLMMISGFFLFMQIHNNEFCFKCYLKDLGYNFENIKYAWPYIPINLFFFSLILNLVSEKKSVFGSILDKIFSFSWLVSIGKVSYGMYIIHRGCSYFISMDRDKFPFLNNNYIFFALYFGIVYLLAVISFHLYEKRFLNLKTRFR